MLIPLTTTHRFHRRLAGPLLIALGGCAQQTDVATADTPAPPATQEPPAQVAASLPPSGHYELTSRTLATDCGPTPSAGPQSALVVVVTEGGTTQVNLPLTVPAAETGSVARSDISLEPGQRIERSRNPVRGCDYEVATVLEVRSVAADAIALEYRVTYGDASACADTHPSQCTTTTEVRYALTEALCAAECTRGAHPRPGVSQGPPAWEVDCACPGS